MSRRWVVGICFRERLFQKSKNDVKPDWIWTPNVGLLTDQNIVQIAERLLMARANVQSAGIRLQDRATAWAREVSSVSSQRINMETLMGNLQDDGVQKSFFQASKILFS